METEKLLEQLDLDTKMRFERVSNWLKPLPVKSEDFVVLIEQARSNAWIADNRAGYIGNPYEQILGDILRIQTEVNKVLSNDIKT
ncbi:hypothetical protein GALL_27330 [mine drainage metagenome]|uniref:Uncharacterized protein n=1 Tax=mine drainage metagenome TaxID=410659 RepID=A0A1J5TL49_9ZZZZ